MPKIEIHDRKRAAICLPALLLACAGLTACGGSSGAASHTSANTASTTMTSTSTTPTTTTGQAAKTPSTGATPLRAPNSTVAPHRRVIVPPAQSMAFRNALGHFATCLRQNGVKIPAPNTSGNGPALSSKGLNTNTPQYRAALLKCRSVLIGAFRQATHAGAAKHG
jgi:hypothetical protein